MNAWTLARHYTTHAVYTLLAASLTAAAASAIPSYRAPATTVGWILAAVAELLTMTVILQHVQRDLCLRCAADVPTSPQAEVRHFKITLTGYHYRPGLAVLSVIMLAACTVSPWFVSGHATRWGISISGLVLLDLTIAVAAATEVVHRRLCLWCPRCHVHSAYGCRVNGCRRHQPHNSNAPGGGG